MLAHLKSATTKREKIQIKKMIIGAARKKEPVSAFASCQPKALQRQPNPSQGKAGRQKKCNSDINQHQLRQEWSEHERLKRNIVEHKIYSDQL